MVSFHTAIKASGGGRGCVKTGLDYRGARVQTGFRHWVTSGSRREGWSSEKDDCRLGPRLLIPKASPLSLPSVLKTGSHWFVQETRIQGSWLGAESRKTAVGVGGTGVSWREHQLPVAPLDPFPLFGKNPSLGLGSHSPAQPIQGSLSAVSPVVSL